MRPLSTPLHDQASGSVERSIRRHQPSAREGASAREHLYTRLADHITVDRNLTRQFVSWQGNRTAPGFHG